MFLVVAVKAEQFPIATILWVVVMVVVFVMDGEFTQIFKLEFPCAASAYPGKKFQCLFAVALLPFFLIASGFGHDAVEFADVRRGFF